MLKPGTRKILKNAKSRNAFFNQPGSRRSIAKMLRKLRSKEGHAYVRRGIKESVG